MKLKTSTSDPNSIIYTHIIPPISQRERGAKVKPKEDLDTRTVTCSDGYRERLSDGTFRTAVPYVHLSEWRKQGKKWAQRRSSRPGIAKKRP